MFRSSFSPGSRSAQQRRLRLVRIGTGLTLAWLTALPLLANPCWEGLQPDSLADCIVRSLEDSPEGLWVDSALIAPHADQLDATLDTLLADERVFAGDLIQDATLAELRGWGAAQRGELDQASEYWSQAIELDPGRITVQWFDSEGGERWRRDFGERHPRLSRIAAWDGDAIPSAQKARAQIERTANTLSLDREALFVRPWADYLPPVTLAGLDGETFELGGPSEKVLLLDFWASWCEPCRRELPYLQQIADDYRDQGLEVIAINVAEEESQIRGFARALGLTLPIAVADTDWATGLDVDGLPVVLLVDRQGTVAARWTGFPDGLEIQLAQRVRSALQTKADEPPEPVQVGERLGTDDKLQPQWVRKFVEPLSGLGTVRPDADEAAIIAAVLERALVLLKSDGSVVQQSPLPAYAATLRSSGVAENSVAVGFRIGGTRAVWMDWGQKKRSGWDAKTPIFDLQVDTRPAQSARALVATLDGLLSWEVGTDDAQMEGDWGLLSSILPAEAGWWILQPGYQAILLNHQLEQIQARPMPAPSWHLIPASSPDAPFGWSTEGVLATAAGEFLPGQGAQLALAFADGRVELLRLDSGETIHRSQWDELVSVTQHTDPTGRDLLLVGTRTQLVALAPGDPVTAAK